MIGVDTKKKEIGGPYRNGGREWQPTGNPVQVSTHDFPDEELGKTVPYGIHDPAANTGWVNVGTDHDTAALAVESVRRWWKGRGKEDYPQAGRLLITADAGGSNGYRTRAWKAELAALALETGLDITVRHFPPGTSKWNRIEHRLFSHITMNWRGRPLTSHELIVPAIAATTTRTGPKVHAELGSTAYETGIRIGDGQMEALPLTRHDWHGRLPDGDRELRDAAARGRGDDAQVGRWCPCGRPCDGSRGAPCDGLAGPLSDQLMLSPVVAFDVCGHGSHSLPPPPPIPATRRPRLPRTTTGAETPSGGRRARVAWWRGGCGGVGGPCADQRRPAGRGLRSGRRVRSGVGSDRPRRRPGGNGRSFARTCPGVESLEAFHDEGVEVGVEGAVDRFHRGVRRALREGFVVAVFGSSAPASSRQPPPIPERPHRTSRCSTRP